MASIGPVQLSILGNNASPELIVQVDYTVRPTNDDVDFAQPYHEVVQLIGVDAAPREDGVDDPIPGGVLLDDTLVLTTRDPITRHAGRSMPRAALEEDGRFQSAEIKAHVTLTPIAAAADSNVVSLSGLVLQS